ncbi:hypothetical protein [uncultured Thiothrix sp.]|nr:hypothetical protein [uncultured Thiothrix sp.]
MSAVAAPSLDVQVEESSSIEVVAYAENDATYAAEPEIIVWNFDPSICG